MFPHALLRAQRPSCRTSQRLSDVRTAARCGFTRRSVIPGPLQPSRRRAAYRDVPPGMVNFTPEEMEQLMMMASNMNPQEREQLMESLLELQAQNAAGPSEYTYEQLRDMADSVTPEMMEELRQRYGDEAEDPEFWSTAMHQPALLQMLEQFLDPQELELMERLLGEDWRALGAMDPTSIMEATSSMTAADRELLLGMMAKMRSLKEDMQAGVIDVSTLTNPFSDFTAQAASAVRSSPISSQEEEDAAPVIDVTPNVTSSSREVMADRAAAAAEASTSGRPPSSFSSSSSRGPSSSPSPQLVSRLMQSPAGPQLPTIDWGCAPSEDFITLQNIHQQLSIVATLDGAIMAAEGWTESDVMGAIQWCDECMLGLMERFQEAEERGEEASIDKATQAALLWMDVCMRDSATGQLEVSPEMLQQFGELLAAAENLEVVKAYVDSLSRIKPQHAELPAVLEAAGFGDPDWFVPPEKREAAFEALQAAASQPPPADAPGATPSTALRPFVSWERIRALAGLDGDSLRFAVDLQRSRFRQDTFFKWSMHPKLGPMLIDGDWVSGQQLPDLLRWLFMEAGADVTGLDLQELTSSASRSSSSRSSGSSSSGGGSSSTSGMPAGGRLYGPSIAGMR